jgi:hypothetical protein
MATLVDSFDGTYTTISSAGVSTTRTQDDVLYTSRTRPARDTSTKPKVFRKPKNYEMESVVRRHYHGSAYYSSGTVRSRVGWLPQAVPISPPTDSSSLVNEALIKALLKLKDQKVNLGVALVEATQTADLVTDVASRIRRAYQAAKRGNFRAAKHHLGLTIRETPSNWLAIQYGVKPLLSDVEGAFQRLKFQPQQAWLTHVEGVAQRQTEQPPSIVNTTWNVRVSETKRSRDIAKVGLWYRPRNDLLIALSNLGVTGLGEVVWEKVPFSFVADWFIPIGDYLSAMDAAFGYDFYAGYRTFFAKSEAEGRYAGPNPGSNVTHGSILPTSSRSVYMKRVAYAVSPLPSVPEFNKSPLSFGRAVNAIALLFGAADKPSRW